MKIYLDDVRSTPEGWIRAYWPKEVIGHLITGRVTHLSLDHDLGHSEITGEDVLKWVEREVALNGFDPPKIYIHTSNPPARLRMKMAVEAINKLSQFEKPINKIRFDFIKYN